MSTRSLLVRKVSDGFKYVYCHNDGYPSHHFPILTEAYATEERVQELFSHGNLSVLHKVIGEKHDFDDRSYPGCYFYGRERGELNQSETHKSTAWQLRTAATSSFAEFIYYWNGKCWTWCGPRPPNSFFENAVQVSELIDNGPTVGVIEEAPITLRIEFILNNLKLIKLEMGTINNKSLDNAISWLENIVNPVTEQDRQIWKDNILPEEAEAILDGNYGDNKDQLMNYLEAWTTDEQIREDLKLFNNITEGKDNEETNTDSTTTDND